VIDGDIGDCGDPVFSIILCSDVVNEAVNFTKMTSLSSKVYNESG